eukprot:3542681-Amphidinium_carterae.1
MHAVDARIPGGGSSCRCCFLVNGPLLVEGIGSLSTPLDRKLLGENHCPSPPGHKAISLALMGGLNPCSWSSARHQRFRCRVSPSQNGYRTKLGKNGIPVALRTSARTSNAACHCINS